MDYDKTPDSIRTNEFGEFEIVAYRSSCSWLLRNAPQRQRNDVVRVTRFKRTYFPARRVESFRVACSLCEMGAGTRNAERFTERGTFHGPRNAKRFAAYLTFDRRLTFSHGSYAAPKWSSGNCLNFVVARNEIGNVVSAEALNTLC